MKYCWRLFTLNLILVSHSARAQSNFTALPATAAFSQWLGQQRKSDTLEPQALANGLRLAQQRHDELRRLLEKEPEKFAQLATLAQERDRLPMALRPFIEQHVKGRGFFGAYCLGFKPAEQSSDSRPGFAYEVRLQGSSYKAFPFGRWRKQQTVLEAEIEGITLDDAIVVGNSPSPLEQLQSGQPVSMYLPSKTGPNATLYLIARFADQTNDPITEASVLTQMTVVSNFLLNASYGLVSIKGLIYPTQAVDIVHITLPQPTSYTPTYNNNFAQLLNDGRSAAAALGYFYTNYNLDVLVTSDPGFSYAGRSYIGSQGSHWVTPYTTLRTAGHELGHNLGLWHANYWRTDSTLPFGRDGVPGYVADISNGEWVEYGHYFCVMSGQYGSEWDDPTKPIYNPVEKVQLGWLTGNQVQYITNSGNYRLFRHDARNAGGIPQGLRIETPATDYTGYGRRYWISYRYAPWNTAQSWFRNGVEIDVAEPGYGSDGSILLDMTPYSADQSSPFYDPRSLPGAWWAIDNSDKMDGALILGRSYDDPAAGIHITAIATGNSGTGQEYIDVVINVGSFVGNHPPTISLFTATTNELAVNETANFSVSATDPDGDTLAYSWDFGQFQTWTPSGLNSSTAAKSWPTPGEYRVRVTVSDLKGGLATASQIVKVGAPINTGQIWGRVLWGGRPVYGARIWTNSWTGASAAQAWTDSDGSYQLTGLNPTNKYSVNCQAAGLTFAPQFINPVTVGAGNSFGIDFYATQSLTNPLPAPLMVVSPYQAQVAIGQTITFRTDAWNTNGTPLALSPVWTVSGGGSIDASGTFSGIVPGGPYTIAAAAGALVATGSIWVLPVTNSILPVLTISVQDTNKLYGAVMPPFTLLYNGFTNGDTPASLSSPPLVITPANASSPPGSYPIHVSGAQDTNYTIRFVEGTLTVLPGATAATITSSANPSLPGQIVSFDVLVAPLPPSAGIPGGALQFKIDGANSATLPLLNGAASYTTATLSHGQHSIGIQYAGDGNFSGTTKLLSPVQLINTPPVPGSNSLSFAGLNGVKIPAANLVSNAADADGDPISLLSVSAGSLNGATIVSNNGWIFYLPAAGMTNADSFPYTISDGYGAPVTGSVLVSFIGTNSSTANLNVAMQGNGTNTIQGDAIPGRTYQIHFADDLSGTNWQFLGTVSADSFGLFQMTDSAASPQRHYRAVYP